MTTFAKKVIDFYLEIDPKIDLPDQVELMNPYKLPETQETVLEFYNKFFNDHGPRVFLFGINPGRFGAGVTGIGFTDPINLENYCGIENHHEKKPELSSVFIYDMIDSYGGVEKFYSNFYITAVCPLGFVKQGKNMNYYDSKKLQIAVEPFIIYSIREQLKFGTIDKCICIGEGQNLKYLQLLNKDHGFFGEIIPLSHPRFILQYRRKKKDDYIKKYLEVLHSCEVLL